LIELDVGNRHILLEKCEGLKVNFIKIISRFVEHGQNILERTHIPNLFTCFFFTFMLYLFSLVSVFVTLSKFEKTSVSSFVVAEVLGLTSVVDSFPGVDLSLPGKKGLTLR